MPKRGSGTAGTNGIWSKKSHLFFPSKRIIPLRTSSKPGKTAACGLDDRTNLSGVSRTQLEESARLAVEGYSDAQTGELRRFNGSNQDYSRPDAANSLIQTEFVAFPDLELADLVRDQRHPNRLRFIIWKKKKAHF